MLQNVKENLVDLNELMEILGYSDERSVKKWCKQNKVPLFHIGTRKYTLTNFLTTHIENLLGTFAKANFSNPDEILEAVKNGEKIQEAKLVVLPKKREEKKQHSEATKKFLTNIKAA
jgi:hypothetical protein